MFEKIKSFLKIINFSGTITLKDGTQVVVDGSLEKGSKVYVQLPDAEEPIALPDGEYPLEDDSILVIVDGVISDIKPKEEEPKQEEPQVEPKQEEQMESVDISDCYPILLADKTEIYIKGDKAYDKDGNPFTDGTFESVAKVSEYKNSFTIKDGIITEQSYTSTETTVMSEEPKNEKLVELEERLSKIEKFFNDNGVMLSKIEKIETEFNSLKEKIETVDGAKKVSTKQVNVELSDVEIRLQRIKNLKK